MKTNDNNVVSFQGLATALRQESLGIYPKNMIDALIILKRTDTNDVVGILNLH